MRHLSLVSLPADREDTVSTLLRWSQMRLLNELMDKIKSPLPASAKNTWF